jgi:adenylate kinase family enzyme
MKNNLYVRWLKSKKDIQYNFEKYRNEDNILFITGLVGSGKSTLARELGKKYNATVIIQDFLAWSDLIDSKECAFFVDMFQKLYPETKNYFKNNEWRKNNLTSEEKNDYRVRFDKMVVDYANENKDRLFIYEGSDLFCKSDINIMSNHPIIIKRTSAIKSYIRNYKRSNHNNTFKKKLEYLKRMKYEFKRFYVQDLPKLNKFIKYLN